MYYVKVIDKIGTIEKINYKVFEEKPSNDMLDFLRAFHNSVEITIPNKEWLEEEQIRIKKIIETNTLLLNDIKGKLNGIN